MIRVGPIGQPVVTANELKYWYATLARRFLRVTGLRGELQEVRRLVLGTVIVGRAGITPALQILLSSVLALLACSPDIGYAQNAEPAPQSTVRAEASAQPPSPPAQQAAPATQADKPFDIHEYRVLGNSVLKNVEIETAVYPFLGDGKTIKDVEGARASLEKTYHDRGYGTVFVDIPEQSVADGVVRLRVTEGRLRQTRVTGARYFSERQVIAQVPAAAEGSVPDLPALQQQLTALNAQTPDRAVVPILKAGPVPGTVDLNLKVDDHLPVHGSVELNNEYTQGTSSLRAAFNLSYANLFSELDDAGVQYQMSPQHTGQVGVFGATYTSRPLLDDLRISGLFINSTSNVASLGAVGILGRGQIYGLRFNVPLGVTQADSNSVILGVDYKHFQETITVNPETTLATPVSYLNFSAGYSGVLRGEHQDVALNLSANFGPSGLVNNVAEFANKRYRSYPNYFYVRGDSTYDAQLPAGMRLTLRLAGQFAVEPLVSNENFSIAGYDGVRGYLEAEQLGDLGIKGTVQVYSPSLHWGSTTIGDAYVFYDAGRVGFLNSLPGEPGEASLSSWGVGFDILPGRYFTGSLVWADPLRSDAGTTLAGESRWLFVVRGSF